VVPGAGRLVPSGSGTIPIRIAGSLQRPSASAFHLLERPLRPTRCGRMTLVAAAESIGLAVAVID
jgi:hypothetical protein